MTLGHYVQGRKTESSGRIVEEDIEENIKENIEENIEKNIEEIDNKE